MNSQVSLAEIATQNVSPNDLSHGTKIIASAIGDLPDRSAEVDNFAKELVARCNARFPTIKTESSPVGDLERKDGLTFHLDYSRNGQPLGSQTIVFDLEPPAILERRRIATAVYARLGTF